MTALHPAIEAEVDWASLEDLEDFDRPVKAREKKKHVCDHCAGSGKWRSRQGNQVRCYPCKGKGYFLSSAADRQKNRPRGRARKKDIKAAFAKQHKATIEALRGMTSWNSFAESLVDQFTERGTLSDKQIAAAERMLRP